MDDGLGNLEFEIQNSKKLQVLPEVKG